MIKYLCKNLIKPYGLEYKSIKFAFLIHILISVEYTLCVTSISSFHIENWRDLHNLLEVFRAGGIGQRCYHETLTAAPSVQLHPTFCDPMDYSTPGLPVHHRLLEFTQTHVHWVGDAIQPSYPLPSPSPLVFSRGRSVGLVFSSLEEFSTVFCDPHS